MVKRAFAFMLLISAALPCYGQAGNSSIVRFGGDGVDGLVQKGTLTETIPLQVNAMTFQQQKATSYQMKSGSVVNCRTSMSILGTMSVAPGGMTSSSGGSALTVVSLGQVLIGASASLTLAGAAGSAGVGANGAGNLGGNGGVLKIASRDKITNLGVISAVGGAGGASHGTANNASGGNGGYVVLIAPVVSAGTVNITGGIAGAGGSGTAGSAGSAGQVIVIETRPQIPLLSQLDNPEVLKRLASAQAQKHRYLSESEIFTTVANGNAQLLAKLQIGDNLVASK